MAFEGFLGLVEQQRTLKMIVFLVMWINTGGKRYRALSLWVSIRNQRLSKRFPRAEAGAEASSSPSLATVEALDAPRPCFLNFWRLLIRLPSFKSCDLSFLVLFSTSLSISYQNYFFRLILLNPVFLSFQDLEEDCDTCVHPHAVDLSSWDNLLPLGRKQFCFKGRQFYLFYPVFHL